VAPLVRTGGSRHTGLAAPPHRNIHEARARYLFTYAPLYIILAVQGFSQWITTGRYSKKCSGEIEKVEQKQNENLEGSHEKLHSETVL